MQTNLAQWLRDTPEGDEAEAILRKCVHCGFCNATCPTYQLVGDELDGPRGRIYLIKQVLEGVEPSDKTQSHLDRCLTCRACETTCPSGVSYGRLVDIGRGVVERKVGRAGWRGWQRQWLGAALANTRVFATLLRLGRAFKFVLPAALARKVPAAPVEAGAWPTGRHARRMLVLAGCVQPALAPRINAAAARVLDRLGISLIEAPGAGCCGAVRYHLNDQSGGLADMRSLIDAWWPLIESERIEAIVMTASGCGSTVKEYGHLLAHDPAYAAKAARISALTRDVSEIVAEALDQPGAASRLGWAESGTVPSGGADDAMVERGAPDCVAFHPPCSLQHGQKIRGVIEHLLAGMGVRLTPVPDSHLCCGSAGTYAILQPELSSRLKADKLAALASGGPRRILSANIGCLTHLAEDAPVPVEHWVEYLDRRLQGHLVQK